MLNIHKDTYETLQYFIDNKSIPHIIFHGPSGSGKRTIVNYFINKIYNNDNQLKTSHVMNVDCGHGKGIKFIREDLKFFAKTNIHSSLNLFKSIILLNADKLTADAQSALRRCIESFSKTTRFFIIVENKYKLLKPILSRFSELYIPRPIINKQEINLHTYNINTHCNKFKPKTHTYLDKLLENNQEINKEDNIKDVIQMSENIYQNGYSAFDLINYIQYTLKDDPIKLHTIIMTFYKIKKEIRNEKFLLFWILSDYFNRSNEDLENMLFI